MPALFGIGVTLALEREMGLLRLKRAQPAPPARVGGREDRQWLRARRDRVPAHRRHGACLRKAGAGAGPGRRDERAR